MSTTELSGDWIKTKGRLKQKFAVLTEKDLIPPADRKEEIIERLQLKLGRTKKELEEIIHELKSY